MILFGWNKKGGDILSLLIPTGSKYRHSQLNDAIEYLLILKTIPRIHISRCKGLRTNCQPGNR